MVGTSRFAAGASRYVMALPSNVTKMNDGGLDRASLGVEVWKPSQKWSVPPAPVRSIVWLDAPCLNNGLASSGKDAT